MDLNNSQQPNNVESCCMCVGSGVQTDATTPNNVGPTVHYGNDTTHKTLWTQRRPRVILVHGPSNVGEAVQMDPTLLCYTSVIREQKECWELFTQKFDHFQTFCTKSQKHATTCKRVCNRIQGTYLSSNMRALVLLTFMGNVNKRRHLKICLLKCDKIWQKSNFSKWRP